MRSAGLSLAHSLWFCIHFSEHADTNLLTTGKLTEHLMATEAEALNRLEAITSQMAKAEGVTEALKASDQMTWVQRMNSIRQRAEEMIMTELVYS